VFDRFGEGEPVRMRVQSFPVDSSRKSGPQTEIMMAVNPMPQPKPSGSVEVDTNDKSHGRFGSSFDADKAADALLNLKSNDNYGVTSVVRPSENTVVITTGDGGAVVTFLSAKSGLQFSIQTQDGVRKHRARTLKDFMKVIDDTLL